MFCHHCGRRAAKGAPGGRRDPFYCTGCDRTPGRCRCEPEAARAPLADQLEPSGDDRCAFLSDDIRPGRKRACNVMRKNHAEEWDGHAFTPKAAAPLAGLDEAWAAVEAVLPSGWFGPRVGPRIDLGPDDAWEASAGPRPVAKYVYGPTPEAALRALAAALSADRAAPEAEG